MFNMNPRMLSMLFHRSGRSNAGNAMNALGMASDMASDPMSALLDLFTKQISGAQQKQIAAQRMALQGLQHVESGFLGASTNDMSYTRMAMSHMGLLGPSRMATSTSTGAINREIANAEFGRRSEEGIAKLAYLTGVSRIPLGGAIGRALGVEATMLNKYQIERDLEGLSRTLSHGLTGDRTSAYGRGFNIGDRIFEQARGKDKLLQTHIGLQQEYNYSAQQLLELQGSAMKTFDAGSLEANIKDRMNRKDGGGRADSVEEAMQQVVGESMRASAAVMRGLGMTKESLDEWVDGLKRFGMDTSRELETAASYVKQVSSASGMSESALGKIMVAGRSFGAQNYLNAGDSGYAFVRRAGGIMQDVRVGGNLTAEMRNILGRYGGANEHGAMNYLQMRQQAGVQFMESGLGMMGRMAMSLGGRGSYRNFAGQGTFSGLMQGGVAAIGANPFAALGATVDESVRGEVARSGLDSALSMSEDLFNRTLGSTVKGEQNRLGAKARILSSMTGLTANQAADEFRRRDAERQAVVGFKVGEDDLTDDEFYKAMKDRALRTGNSVAYEAELYSKRGYKQLLKHGATKHDDLATKAKKLGDYVFQDADTRAQQLADDIRYGLTDKELRLKGLIQRPQFAGALEGQTTTLEDLGSWTGWWGSDTEKLKKQRTFTNSVESIIGAPGVAQIRSLMRKTHGIAESTDDEDIDIRGLVDVSPDRLNKIRADLVSKNYDEKAIQSITNKMKMLNTDHDMNLHIDKEGFGEAWQDMTDTQRRRTLQGSGIDSAEIEKLVKKQTIGDQDFKLLTEHGVQYHIGTQLYNSLGKEMEKLHDGKAKDRPLFVQIVKSKE